MGITFMEFSTAMETYGATRLPDEEGTRIKVLVPCFQVGETKLLHSGSYYVVQLKNRVAEETMRRAMAECSEKHPGGDNFWYGEIHSVRGVLTLAAMIDGKYTKELVDELLNKTYAKLLSNPSVTKREKSPYKGKKTAGIQKLREVIAEYDSVVNMFESYKIRQPMEYLSKISVSVAIGEGKKDKYVRLYLKNKVKPLELSYISDKEGWGYQAYTKIQKERRDGLVAISHYFDNGKSGRMKDEVIYVGYSPTKTNKHRYDYDPSLDVDLRISIKTGLAWRTYHEKDAKPATDEEIQLAIIYLKRMIKKIKKQMLYIMVERDA